MPTFPLGALVATPGALDSATHVERRAVVRRHASGDWGELDAQDRRENERSLKYGWRVLSSYPVGDERVWVITEADRSITTILLPDEY